MLKLGVIYQNGHIIGHRSLLKILVNPWLRLIGLQIATQGPKNGKLGRPCIARCFRRRLSFSWSYDLTGLTLEKKRRII